MIKIRIPLAKISLLMNPRGSSPDWAPVPFISPFLSPDVLYPAIHTSLCFVSDITLTSAKLSDDPSTAEISIWNEREDDYISMWSPDGKHFPTGAYLRFVFWPQTLWEDYSHLIWIHFQSEKLTYRNKEIEGPTVRLHFAVFWGFVGIIREQTRIHRQTDIARESSDLRQEYWLWKYIITRWIHSRF